MKLFDVYSLYPVEPVKGCGSYVYDKEGREYLDLYGGHAVISIGHAHPHYVEAISRQVAKLGFYSNSVENSLQEQLAEKLGRISGYPDYSLFLANSGAEANENAAKLASFHTGRSKILAFKGAFHGRTSGAVALTDNPKIQSPFNSTENVTFVALNDLEAVQRELDTKEYAAVIIEGIQGVAGIQMPTDQFLRDLRDLTRKTGTVLILDEVQSGYGRTGRFFAHQYAGIRPDLITVAKGMGNGFPIGGVLISPEFKAVKGMLGTTFGGNHLACAAAIAVLDVIESENLVENAAKVGEYAIAKLHQLMEASQASQDSQNSQASQNSQDSQGPQASQTLARKDSGLKIAEVRGRGLMIGIEINGSASELRKKILFEHGIFTGGAGQTTVRLLPALSVTAQMIDRFISALANS